MACQSSTAKSASVDPSPESHTAKQNAKIQRQTDTDDANATVDKK